MTLKDQFEGCLLGLACGDAFCAEFEGGLLERVLWKCIGRTFSGQKRYTDDTQMSLDLASYFLENDNFSQQDLAMTFAKGYRWSRGYGPAASTILRGIRRGKHWKNLNRKKFKDGSFGNGAAMRSPIIGLFFFKNESKIEEYCEKISQITHAHEQAIDSSVLVASIIYFLLQGDYIFDAVQKAKKKLTTEAFDLKVSELCQFYTENKVLSSKEIIKLLGNSVSAIKSVPTAIYIALVNENNSFHSLLEHCKSVGGDTDTIASIAGAIWGAKNGSFNIDNTIIEQVEGYKKIREVAKCLHDKATKPDSIN